MLYEMLINYKGAIVIAIIARGQQEGVQYIRVSIRQ
jgi:hypothetical protein